MDTQTKGILVRAVLLNETEKAYFVKFKRKGFKKTRWIPKSRTKITNIRKNEMSGATVHTFEIEQWLWNKIVEEKKKYIPPKPVKPIDLTEYPFCPEYKDPNYVRRYKEFNKDLSRNIEDENT
jgi:hypothetical protein